jgi:hypothetical protein
MRYNVRLFIAALAALAAASLALPVAASATPQVPWTDPNAKGYIGFCNAANQQIYSGSIDSYPFVAKAVASTPAPTGYGAKVGRATLYAFQPLQELDPGDWSGKQMTGATVYSNSSEPMALGLPADAALVNFSAAFPLRWEGFAQLRMFYTAPNAQPYSATYPAVAVVVSGQTWTQVGGGPVNCAGGQAESDEADLKIANNLQSQGGAAKASGNEVETATSSAHPTASGSSAGPKSAVSDGASTSLSPVAATAKRSSGGSSPGVAIGIAVAVAGSAAGIALFLRRRRGLE